METPNPPPLDLPLLIKIRIFHHKIWGLTEFLYSKEGFRSNYDIGNIIILRAGGDNLCHVPLYLLHTVC